MVNGSNLTASPVTRLHQINSLIYPVNVVVLLIGICGLFGNGLLVLATFRRGSRLVTKSSLLIGIMACADIVSNVGFIQVWNSTPLTISVSDLPAKLLHPDPQRILAVSPLPDRLVLHRGLLLLHADRDRRGPVAGREQSDPLSPLAGEGLHPDDVRVPRWLHRLARPVPLADSRDGRRI